MKRPSKGPSFRAQQKKDTYTPDFDVTVFYDWKELKSPEFSVYCNNTENEIILTASFRFGKGILLKSIQGL